MMSPVGEQLKFQWRNRRSPLCNQGAADCGGGLPGVSIKHHAPITPGK